MLGSFGRYLYRLDFSAKAYVFNFEIAFAALLGCDHCVSFPSFHDSSDARSLGLCCAVMSFLLVICPKYFQHALRRCTSSHPLLRFRNPLDGISVWFISAACLEAIPGLDRSSRRDTGLALSIFGAVTTCFLFFLRVPPFVCYLIRQLVLFRFSFVYFFYLQRCALLRSRLMSGVFIECRTSLDIPRTLHCDSAGVLGMDTCDPFGVRQPIQLSIEHLSLRHTPDYFLRYCPSPAGVLPYWTVVPPLLYCYYTWFCAHTRLYWFALYFHLFDGISCVLLISHFLFAWVLSPAHNYRSVHSNLVASGLGGTRSGVPARPY